MGEKLYSDIDRILEKFDHIGIPNASISPELANKLSGTNVADNSPLSEDDEFNLLSLNRSLLTLQSAFSAIASSVGHMQVLGTFTWEMANLLQAECCLVYEYDALNDDLAFLFAYPSLEELPQLDHRQLYRLAAVESVQRVIGERSVYQVNTYSSRDEIGTIELLQRFNAESVMMLPMVFQERPIGLIIVLESRSPRTFGNQEVSLAQLLTDQATGALVNAQLYQSLAMANDQLAIMNAELDSYAHTVAHNLKNPLSNILGFSQVLKESNEELPAEELDQYLGYISDSAVKIREIIDGLLLLARIRREEVVFEPIDMAMVVDEALSTLSTLMDEYKPEISLPANWPTSWGNNNWVEQIWLNYLSNGLKYGGRPPKLALGAKLQPDGMVRFWVADNGAGLSQEQQAKLFRPFTRLSVSDAKGHGLGLSIVQNMVMKLGGQVGIESQPDQGSLFYFTLPGSMP